MRLHEAHFSVPGAVAWVRPPPNVGLGTTDTCVYGTAEMALEEDPRFDGAFVGTRLTQARRGRATRRGRRYGGTQAAPACESLQCAQPRATTPGRRAPPASRTRSSRGRSSRALARRGLLLRVRRRLLHHPPRGNCRGRWCGGRTSHRARCDGARVSRPAEELARWSRGLPPRREDAGSAHSAGKNVGTRVVRPAHAVRITSRCSQRPDRTIPVALSWSS